VREFCARVSKSFGFIYCLHLGWCNRRRAFAKLSSYSYNVNECKWTRIDVKVRASCFTPLHFVPWRHHWPARVQWTKLTGAAFKMTSTVSAYKVCKLCVSRISRIESVRRIFDATRSIAFVACVQVVEHGSWSSKAWMSTEIRNPSGKNNATLLLF